MLAFKLSSLYEIIIMTLGLRETSLWVGVYIYNTLFVYWTYYQLIHSYRICDVMCGCSFIKLMCAHFINKSVHVLCAVKQIECEILIEIFLFPLFTEPFATGERYQRIRRSKSNVWWGHNLWLGHLSTIHASHWFVRQEFVSHLNHSLANRQLIWNDFFLIFSCNCADNQQCIRTDDNLSASTYEYKCKIKKS
jgi:hypothetical protein